MSKICTFTETENKLATARTWAKRIDALLQKKQKKNPAYSEAQFCRDYGFGYAAFNRNKNLRVVPTREMVDRIETALKKERV
jgi:hypothetical protein